MTHYPSFEEVLALETKPSILEVHRSLRSVLSSLLLFLVCVLAVYLLNLFFPDFRFKQDLPLIKHFSLRWLAVVPAVVLLEIVRKHHDDLYILNIDTITHHEGRLSLTSSLPSLKYTDILRMCIKQDIMGRIFNYGDIELDSAGEQGVELTIRGVRAPHELMALIERLRSYNLERTGNQDNAPAKAFEASNT